MHRPFSNRALYQLKEQEVMSSKICLTYGQHLPDDVVDRILDVHCMSVYCWSCFIEKETGRFIPGLRFANHADEYLVDGFYFLSSVAAEHEVDRLNQWEGISTDLVDWIIYSQDWVRHPLVDISPFWGSASS